MKPTTVVVMQPYFLPYIGYFHLLHSADFFVSFDDVNFIKKGWINRNRILMNGTAHPISLPIRQMSQNKKINESFLFEPEKSKQSIVRLILDAYRKKAPYFEENFETLKSLILHPEENLALYNHRIIVGLADYLGLKAQVRSSSEFPEAKDLKSTEKILAIVRSLGGTTYVNASGGMELYNPNDFLQRNVALRFIKSGQIAYDQKFDPFVPGLSIVDVFMYAGREKVMEYLKQYALVDPEQTPGL